MLRSSDIPVAHTPEGGWRGEMPPPILAGCDEPLSPDAPDLRGTWRSLAVEQNDQPLSGHPLNSHVERIEQCGNRIVITAGGVIHDMRADGTLENGVDDVAAADMKQRIRVSAVFNGGRLDLYPMGYSPDREPLVTREVIDRRLIWHYGPFRVVLERMGEPDEGARELTA